MGVIMCCGSALKRVNKIIDTAQDIATGIAYAAIGKNQELYLHRRKICKTSGHNGTKCIAFLEVVEICDHCKCPIDTRARVHKMTCPLKKW